MKLPLLILLTLTSSYVMSQQLNVKYRTAIDSAERSHHLVFIDESNCILTFPASGHEDAMAYRAQNRNFFLKYIVINDTLTLQGGQLDTSNLIVRRLRKSRFIKVDNKKIFDCVSGYTYVDEKLTSSKCLIYSIDGKIFKQRAPRTNSYGLVVKSYGTNKSLSKQINQLDKDNYDINILKGKAAYDKYGLIGINGIIEFEQKK